MNVDRWGRVPGDEPLPALNRYTLQMKINCQGLGKLQGQRSPVYTYTKPGTPPPFLPLPPLSSASPATLGERRTRAEEAAARRRSVKTEASCTPPPQGGQSEGGRRRVLTRPGHTYLARERENPHETLCTADRVTGTSSPGAGIAAQEPGRGVRVGDPVIGSNRRPIPALMSRNLTKSNPSQCSIPPPPPRSSRSTEPARFFFPVERDVRTFTGEMHHPPPAMSHHSHPLPPPPRMSHHPHHPPPPRCLITPTPLLPPPRYVLHPHPPSPSPRYVSSPPPPLLPAMSHHPPSSPLCLVTPPPPSPPRYVSSPPPPPSSRYVSSPLPPSSPLCLITPPPPPFPAMSLHPHPSPTLCLVSYRNYLRVVWFFSPLSSFPDQQTAAGQRDAHTQPAVLLHARIWPGHEARTPDATTAGTLVQHPPSPLPLSHPPLPHPLFLTLRPHSPYLLLLSPLSFTFSTILIQLLSPTLPLLSPTFSCFCVPTLPILTHLLSPISPIFSSTSPYPPTIPTFSSYLRVSTILPTSAPTLHLLFSPVSPLISPTTLPTFPPTSVSPPHSPHLPSLPPSPSPLSPPPLSPSVSLSPSHHPSLSPPPLQ
ncbi:hypothetical protein C7M84_019090 [Penaeus vannamei]|uniref:Uncharacterized protein n=1 Tax=Penaeus vannamei TaxID=6689 RepID=A0A3R7LZB1_PENVA|nr:hypothetical protein C7M84_019090 [Penaeus vannamei]